MLFYGRFPLLIRPTGSSLWQTFTQLLEKAYSWPPLLDGTQPPPKNHYPLILIHTWSLHDIYSVSLSNSTSFWSQLDLVVQGTFPYQLDQYLIGYGRISVMQLHVSGNVRVRVGSGQVDLDNVVNRDLVDQEADMSKWMGTGNIFVSVWVGSPSNTCQCRLPNLLCLIGLNLIDSGNLALDASFQF